MSVVMAKLGHFATFSMKIRDKLKGATSLARTVKHSLTIPQQFVYTPTVTEVKPHLGLGLPDIGK